MANLTKFEHVAINLRSMTLGDTYAIDRLVDTALGESFGGSLYGWPWGCTIRKRTESSKRYALSGDYDISELLKRYITFSSNLAGATDIMNHVAAQLGKTPSLAIDDFTIRPLGVQTTVMGCIGSLFSWTSQTPQALVNVFLRGGTLYAVQRGKESGTYSLQTCEAPSIAREIIDTLMDESLIEPVLIGEETTESDSYYSGIKGFGDATVSYTNGLVVAETYTGSEGTVLTSYMWSAPSPPAVLSQKTMTITGVKTISTDYDYSAPWGVVYLCKETEVEEDADSNVIRTTIKRFTDVGNDSYKCDIEENGKLISSQIVKGSSVQTASPLANKKYTTSQRKITVMSRMPIGGASFPVTDQASLDRIAAHLEWLDGKTQETVTVACYDTHICDFTETIAYMGTVYYLDGNTIHVTPRKIWQELSLVRWF